MNRDAGSPTFAQELVDVVRAGTPIIYVETTEDERVEQAIQEMRRDLAPRIFTWTATAGLEERLDDETASPAIPAPNAEALLAALLSIDDDGTRDLIVLAHDLVGAHQQSPRELRLFKDLYRAWEPAREQPHRRTLLMTGVGWTLPAVLAGYVDTRSLPLPRSSEIAADFADRREQLATVGLTPELLGDRAVGLPKLTVEQAFRRIRCSVPGHASGGEAAAREAALAILEDVKREEIRRTNLLDIIPVDRAVGLGGFAAFMRWFDARREFLLRPGRDSLRPRGVVLLGYPGCGKSHAARWIANQLKLPLVAMDFGRIQDKWVGSSEARLNSALRTIEACAPLVLLIDEIEKAFAGVGTETTGVTTRMAGQFLTWLSDRAVPVFIVATCNSAKIPAELTRAGRFDANFLVGLPLPEERRQICRAVAAPLNIELQDHVIAEIAERTEGFSGAEIRQVLIEAAYLAGFDNPDISCEHVARASESVTPLSRRARGEELRGDYDAAREDGGYLYAGDLG